MKVSLDEKNSQLLEKLIEQFARFNGNLEDFKKMTAPWLGFTVKKEEVKSDES